MTKAIVLACLLSLSAFATTLTFPGPEALLPGSTSEGIYSYQVLSGSILRKDCCGSPQPHLEGAASGGVLSITRNDTLGALFTFVSADVAQFNRVGVPILVQGFRQGILQQTDNLATLAAFDTYATRASLNLSGVQIDELRITLDFANTTGPSFQEMDNVVLAESNVPEPTTSLLILTGLTAIVSIRRKNRSAPE